MKKLLKKPGFEFIFAFALAMILGLPPILLAQIKTQKDVDIRIANGDTIINGKNMKDLSGADRESALNDIHAITGGVKYNRDNGERHNYFFKRIDTPGGKMRHFEFQDKDEMPKVSGYKIFKDSASNIVITRRGKMGDGNKKMTFSYRFNDENPDDMDMRERSFNRMPMREMRRHERRNTQHFDFENTNNDGAVTHVTFHVSDASDDDLKRMPYVEGPKSEINDLNLVPQFSSGKILLMFNLLAKGPSEVTLSDSEGKTLWTEKGTGSSFSKSFSLGLNGVYYLKVKQGKNIALKKIMKEE